MSKISFSHSAPAAAASVVEVQAQVVPTPVPGVTVEAITTVSPAAPAAPAAAVPTTMAIAIPTAPVGVPAQTDSPIEFDEDDIKFSDVYLPRVNIVQNIGDLMKVFNPGEIILNATQVLHTPPNPSKKVVGNLPLKIVVFGFQRKKFVEKTSGGDSGAIVNTERDVVNAGGTLAYKEWQASVNANKANPAQPVLKYFQPYSVALILIERPEHIKDEEKLLFPYECDGKRYALALWGMKGTSFTHAAKHFFTARKLGHLREGYNRRAWTFTTKLETFGSNMAHVPVVDPAEATSEPLRVFMNDLIGATTTK